MLRRVAEHGLDRGVRPGEELGRSHVTSRAASPHTADRAAADPRQRRRRPARWVGRLACVLLSTALSLLAAEAFLRSKHELFETGYQASANPKLVYELTPGQAIPRLQASISSQGLNDREFTTEKPPGVFRIAVVGDSTSFGWKVGTDKGLAKVLERELNALGKRSYEVINFSVPGYNTAQELEVIQAKVLPFRPDIVILVFTGNDVRLCNYIQPEPTRLGALMHRSYLANLLVRTVDEQLAQPHGENFAYPAWWLRLKWLRLGVFYPRQKIYPQPGLEEAVYEHGNPPDDPLRVPRRYHYMLGYPRYRAHLAAIRDLLARGSIVLVSSGILTVEAVQINRALEVEHIVTGLWPEELERDYDPGEALVLPNDGHYSVRGHELAARRILDYLVEHELV
jgi:GDSL-like Lipase/Acylhydrolase family